MAIVAEWHEIHFKTLYVGENATLLLLKIKLDLIMLC